jgi:hypothetical protein
MKKVLTVVIAILASIATAFTILTMLVVSGIIELPHLPLYFRNSRGRNENHQGPKRFQVRIYFHE